MDDSDEYDLSDDAERCDREAERWTCIGAGCINPHMIHTRDECFTVEMAAAHQDE